MRHPSSEGEPCTHLLFLRHPLLHPTKYPPPKGIFGFFSFSRALLLFPYTNCATSTTFISTFSSVLSRLLSLHLSCMFLSTFSDIIPTTSHLSPCFLPQLQHITTAIRVFNSSPKTTPINTQTCACETNNHPTTTAALLVSLYYTRTSTRFFMFLRYRSHLIYDKILLLLVSCCCCLLYFAALLLLILRHMLSFSSLASPSFGLITYFSSLFSS